MKTMPAAAGYTRTAISLHWLIAVLIACGFTLGLIVSEMSFSPQKLRYLAYHKWVGVTVFLLAVARLLWRLTHQPPSLVPMPTWQVVTARFSHALLYTLMFVVPVVGWLFSSAAGVPVVYLEVWRLPDLLSKNKALAAMLSEIHANCAWLLFYVVLLHVLAAIKHHWFDQDDTLRRMMRRQQ